MNAILSGLNPETQNQGEEETPRQASATERAPPSVDATPRENEGEEEEEEGEEEQEEEEEEDD